MYSRKKFEVGSMNFTIVTELIGHMSSQNKILLWSPATYGDYIIYELSS